MILLMGGTSESVTLAESLADAGFDVLVSMATETPMQWPQRREITVRRGRMTSQQMCELLRRHLISAVVDAMHPYAVEAHANIQAAAAECKRPLYRLMRPETLLADSQAHWANDHEEAARIAASFHRPILLTTGSRNLRPYVDAARNAHIAITARVLPGVEAETACQEVGLTTAEVVHARGPFSLQENLRLIREHDIGVLVSKESGAAGGVTEKLAAAQISGAEVVLVRRSAPPKGRVFFEIHKLVRALQDSALVI